LFGLIQSIQSWWMNGSNLGSLNCCCMLKW
jgi:hypothetical protein